jgi:uroporphyrinogen-III synthase
MPRVLTLRPLPWGETQDAPGNCALLRIVPDLPPERVQQIHDFLQNCDWLVFTSANGVRIFHAHFSQKLGTRTKVAVVGNATKRVAEECGYAVSLVPERFHGKALAQELSRQLKPASRVLLARAREAAPLELPGIVLDAPIYRSEPIHENWEKLKGILRENPPDWIVFSSPSQVRVFAKICGENTGRLQIQFASIGPSTTQAMEEAGIPHHSVVRGSGVSPVRKTPKK